MWYNWQVLTSACSSTLIPGARTLRCALPVMASLPKQTRPIPWVPLLISSKIPMAGRTAIPTTPFPRPVRATGIPPLWYPCKSYLDQNLLASDQDMLHGIFYLPEERPLSIIGNWHTARQVRLASNACQCVSKLGWGEAEEDEWKFAVYLCGVKKYSDSSVDYAVKEILPAPPKGFKSICRALYCPC